MEQQGSFLLTDKEVNLILEVYVCNMPWFYRSYYLFCSRKLRYLHTFCSVLQNVAMY